VVGVAEDRERGMPASLHRGLEVAAAVENVDAVVITLVDLPDLGADAVRRIASVPTGTVRSALRQAPVR
jgi:molybdenum cofactor cytidylyltransferase